MLSHFRSSRGSMTKLTVAAALILSGFNFGGKALFAQHDPGKPLQPAVAKPAGASVPRLQDIQGVPVFKITPGESNVKFDVEASVSIEGKFDKWDATLTFTSPDVSTGVLDIKIQADSVDTGSGMKDGKLKSKEFFDVKQNPLITFHSDKIVQTGPDTFDLPGTFTIRGVSKPE